jgi:hypothetical protein
MWAHLQLMALLASKSPFHHVFPFSMSTVSLFVSVTYFTPIIIFLLLQKFGLSDGVQFHVMFGHLFPSSLRLIHWELNWIWIACKFICDICKYSESLTPLACNDTFATRRGVETCFYLGSIRICFKVSGEPQNESYIWT